MSSPPPLLLFKAQLVGVDQSVSDFHITALGALPNQSQWLEFDMSPPLVASTKARVLHPMFSTLDRANLVPPGIVWLAQPSQCTVSVALASLTTATKETVDFVYRIASYKRHQWSIFDHPPDIFDPDYHAQIDIVLGRELDMHIVNSLLPVCVSIPAPKLQVCDDLYIDLIRWQLSTYDPDLLYDGDDSLLKHFHINGGLFFVHPVIDVESQLLITASKVSGTHIAIISHKARRQLWASLLTQVDVDAAVYDMGDLIQQDTPSKIDGGVDLVIYDFVKCPYTPALKTKLHSSSSPSSIVLVRESDYEELDELTLLDLLNVQIGRTNLSEYYMRSPHILTHVPMQLISKKVHHIDAGLNQTLSHRKTAFEYLPFSIIPYNDATQSLLQSDVCISGFPCWKADTLSDMTPFCSNVLREAQAQPPACPVCTENGGGVNDREMLLLRCGHTLCLDCLLSWKRAKVDEDYSDFSCPFCRSVCPIFNDTFVVRLAQNKQSLMIRLELTVQIHQIIRNVGKRGRVVIVDPIYLLDGLRSTRRLKHFDMSREHNDARTIGRSTHVYMTGQVVRAGVSCSAAAWIFTDKQWLSKNAQHFVNVYANSDLYVLVAEK